VLGVIALLGLNALPPQKVQVLLQRTFQALKTKGGANTNVEITEISDLARKIFDAARSPGAERAAAIMKETIFRVDYRDPTYLRMAATITPTNIANLRLKVEGLCRSYAWVILGPDFYEPMFESNRFMRFEYTPTDTLALIFKFPFSLENHFEED